MAVILSRTTGWPARHNARSGALRTAKLADHQDSQIGGYRTSVLSRPLQRVTVIAVTRQAVTSRLRRLRWGHKCQWLCGEELRVQPASLERTTKGSPVFAATVAADVSAGRQRAVGQNDWPAPAARPAPQLPFRYGRGERL